MFTYLLFVRVLDDVSCCLSSEVTKRSLTVRVVVVGRSMRSPVSLMFVLYYLDDVADGVGESNIVMITSVVASSSWTWCPSVE